MPGRQWFRLAAMVVYVIAVLFVLNRCARSLEEKTPSPKPDAPMLPVAATRTSTAESAKRDDDAKLSPEARSRAAKKQMHDRQVAERLERHRQVEADLQALATSDIPAALKELGEEATRFRNKRADLKLLETRAKWERELPVKDALTRVRELIADYYASDREAQKGREGPTEHADTSVQQLTKRLQEFRKRPEDIAGFAAELAAFAGKVPEKLLLSAIDSIAQLSLPKDAFDPCRDPAASTCPRPEFAFDAPAGANASTNAHRVRPLAFLSEVRAGQRVCVNAAGESDRIPLLNRPGSQEPVAQILPNSCRLRATGRVAQGSRTGMILWLEVRHDDGPLGWISVGFVRSAS